MSQSASQSVVGKFMGGRHSPISIKNESSIHDVSAFGFCLRKTILISFILNPYYGYYIIIRYIFII